MVLPGRKIHNRAWCCGFSIAALVLSCALMQSGGIRCWGDNSKCQLGDGSNANRSTPAPERSIDGTTIVAGSDHTCVVNQTGGVRCWGDNSSGQLGDGTRDCSWWPQLSDVVTGAAAIALGGLHSCVLGQNGGVRGFNKVIWQAKLLSVQSLELTYTSKDREEGYPGTLDVKVTYTITDNNELRIDYVATEAADKDTVVNLTNHSYFNLTGNPEHSILDHVLTLDALRFTPVDSGLIPTGELRGVKGTPFDFTTATAIGTRINQDDEQLKLGKGYDHNFALDRTQGARLAKAAEVYDPLSGRVMEISTTEPGIQLYSGNFLDGSIKGKGNQVYGFRSGFCLETQHFPDSPNQPQFPTTTLKAGQKYASTTVFRFSTR